MFFPYGKQHIDDDDVNAVVEVLKSPYLTTGPVVRSFESALEAYLHAPHVVSCSSGTAGLHMAAVALGLSEGDVVIVPAITFVATANAPSMTGAKIVFADVDPQTGLMTPETLDQAISRARTVGRPRAVFPVHLNGQCVNMDALSQHSRQHDLFIVEDACHAIGGTVIKDHGEEVPVGACAWSDMTVFSFHPVKMAAMGEGGAVSTQNDVFAKRLKMFRGHGLTREASEFTEGSRAFDETGAANPWYYEMQSLGSNYRAPDITCALGLSQLRKIDQFVETRQNLVSTYDELLKDLAPYVTPLPRMSGQRPGWHLYVVHIDFEAIGMTRAKVMQELHGQGIGTQVHYIPVSDQPYWKSRVDTPPLPGAADYYRNVLSLPLYVDMTVEDVAYIVDKLSSLITT